MPPTCQTCKSENVSEINALIAQGVSLRNIAAKFDTPYSRLDRHKHNCIQAVVKAKADERLFSFEGELTRLWNKAYKMVDALEEWLADPDDPTKLNIDPRDDEITVVYLDHKDVNDKGKPAKKTARLRDLLKRIDAEMDGEPIAVMSKAEDNRKLYLAAFKTLTDRLEQMGKFYGHWQQDKPNESEEQRALKAAQFALLAQTGPRCETREDWAELVDKMIGLAPVLKGRREEIVGWWDK